MTGRDGNHARAGRALSRRQRTRKRVQWRQSPGACQGRCPMAKKKRKPDGERPKQRKQSSPADSPDIPDRRAMEGVLHELVHSLPGAADQDTPQARAQALVYQAFKEKDE